MTTIREQVLEDSALLRLMLEAAVPLWAGIAAGWTPERRALEADELAGIIATGSDIVFRGSRYEPAHIMLPTLASLGDDQMRRGVKARDYRPAEIFNALAKALGIAAHTSGGVTFLGQHWCADHAACEEAGVSRA